MDVLYRKYRPQTFGDVVGQDHVTRTLVAALAANRVAHAYLFSGPRGVGKTTSARLLSRALNCDLQKGADAGGVVPCNSCVSCASIAQGTCVDVLEIDAASHTGVDHVREHIIEASRLAPAQSRCRVFIIDEVHMLSTSAFSALLKTIEEPPGHVYFVFATTEPHRVPETIRSRCQHFAFRRVPDDHLGTRLKKLAADEHVAVDEAVMSSVIRAADGSVRDAESMLGQLFAVGKEHITEEEASLILPRSSVAHAERLVAEVHSGDVVALLKIVATAEEEGFDATAFCKDIIGVLRLALHRDVREQPSSVTGHTRALRSFIDVLDDLKRADRPFFSLEVAGLDAMTFPSAVRDVDSPGDAHSGSDESAKPPATSTKENTDSINNVQVPPVSQTVVTESIGGNAIEPTTDIGEVNPSTAQLLSRIQAAWGDLITKLGRKNHSLPYMLESGRPKMVEDGVLTIGFRYQIYAEKVKQPGLVDLITEAVSTFAGTPLRIAPVLIDEQEFTKLVATTRPTTGDATIDSAVAIFGGGVVQ
jgi:DNA polymerase III subunit gamma/tau